MKKYLLISISFLIALNLTSQNKTLIKPKIDKRVELLSIAFRLADADEYNSKAFKKYTNSIETHFNAYKNHDLIKYIKKIREENNIGYDAVMFMAIHISNPPELKPLVTFDDGIPEKRWNKEISIKFLKLLRAFYIDTNFENFFEANKLTYTTSSERFMGVYDMLDINWYEAFYDEKPNGSYHIINGIGNGVGNYGGKVVYPDRTDRYSIIGVWSTDSLGMPKYSIREHFPLLVHEINHSFINHLTEASKENLEFSGQKIFNRVEEPMNNQAYGNWQTMINESLVRASVLKYIQDHDFGEREFNGLLINEVNNGFLWTEALVNELNRYDKNRDKFPTLKSFIPEIEKFFKSVAKNIDEIKSSIENKKPKVIKMSPFKNGNKNVDSEIKEIKFTFDKPLIGKGYSYIKGDKGKDAMPNVINVKYSENRKAVIFKVKLIPNKVYQFKLMGAAFKSVEGYGMDIYEVNFKTKS